MNKIFLQLAFIFCASSAWAFRLTPMTVNFAPEGNKATQVLILENNGSEKVPVQIEATTREVSVDGIEKRNKTNDFVIYPEQVVLLPNEKRNVRVTWSGTGKISSEKAFRLIASQLPLEFHEQNARVQKNGAALTFLVQYVASAYVTPANAKSKVKVVSAKLLKPRQLELEIVNEGTAHRLLHPKKIQIFSEKKLVLEMAQVKELDSENILADSRRKISIKLPKDIPNKEISVNLNLEDITD